MSGRIGVIVASVLAVTLPLAEADASRTIRREPLVERGTVLHPPVLPPRFRGHWSISRSDCGRAAVEDDQVWITGTSLHYYETAGTMTRVVIRDPRHAVVTVRTDGEGIRFVARKGLALSPDGRSLSIRDEDDTASTRFRRCAVHRMSR